jgi:steroid 5-alpha reductase family enzyme
MDTPSRWLGTLASTDYLILCAAYAGFMTALWWLRPPLRNAGLVDFGWPTGLVTLAVFFFVTGDGWLPRRAVISGLIAACGLRFMAGWAVRAARDGEDRRWEFWRRHWQAGNGPLGLRSVDLNFLAFYHNQTLSTLMVFAALLALPAGDPRVGFRPLEVAAIGLWVVSFALENVADVQLDRFRRSPAGGKEVCRAGLWAYSRHPNYFFEFLLWVAYTLYAWGSAGNWLDRAVLVAVPAVAYWFLVHYTGVPLTELASLERRGEPFRRYQAEVSRFVPWLPRRSAEEKSVTLPAPRRTLAELTGREAGDGS